MSRGRKPIGAKPIRAQLLLVLKPEQEGRFAAALADAQRLYGRPMSRSELGRVVLDAGLEIVAARLAEMAASKGGG